MINKNKLKMFACVMTLCLGVNSIPAFAISSYNRNDAASYARKYAESPNSAYTDYGDQGGDCTNFVSQCLKAGGISTNSKWKPYTDKWILANPFRNYLKDSIDYNYKTYTVKQARDNWSNTYSLLWPGDVVQYGSSGNAGHSQIVTSWVSRDQSTYICQHSTIENGKRVGYSKSVSLLGYLYGRPGSDTMFIHQIKNGE